MDNGLKNLKLVLMGIVIVTVPILFIMQASKTEADKEKTSELELKVATLNNYTEYLRELIKLYSTQLANEVNRNRDKPKCENRIFFNPTIQTATTGLSTLPNYSDQLQQLINTVNSFTSLPQAKQLDNTNQLLETLLKTMTTNTYSANDLQSFNREELKERILAQYVLLNQLSHRIGIIFDYPVFLQIKDELKKSKNVIVTDINQK